MTFCKPQANFLYLHSSLHTDNNVRRHTKLCPRRQGPRECPTTSSAVGVIPDEDRSGLPTEESPHVSSRDSQKHSGRKILNPCQ